MNQKYDFKKDSIIAQLYPTPNPLLWQIAKVRSLNFNLGNIKDSQIAHEYVDSIKQIFSNRFSHQKLNECWKRHTRKIGQDLISCLMEKRLKYSATS